MYFIFWEVCSSSLVNLNLSGSRCFSLRWHLDFINARFISTRLNQYCIFGLHFPSNRNTINIGFRRHILLFMSNCNGNSVQKQKNNNNTVFFFLFFLNEKLTKRNAKCWMIEQTPNNNIRHKTPTKCRQYSQHLVNKWRKVKKKRKKTYPWVISVNIDVNQNLNEIEIEVFFLSFVPHFKAMDEPECKVRTVCKHLHTKLKNKIYDKKKIKNKRVKNEQKKIFCLTSKIYHFSFS